MRDNLDFYVSSFLLKYVYNYKEDTMAYPTTEQVEKARQASLADFFIQNGYETERSRNELHIKGYGGLYVNVETNEW